jgi:hypothetical protein
VKPKVFNVPAENVFYFLSIHEVGLILPAFQSIFFSERLTNIYKFITIEFEIEVKYLLVLSMNWRRQIAFFGKPPGSPAKGRTGRSWESNKPG